MAATEDDCTPLNTLSAPADDAADIQFLLDADTAIVCLSGTFTLASPLTFNHNLTLFGLASGELDGDDLTGILTGTAAGELTVQNLSFINGAATNGGAINVDGELFVENSQFTNNSASATGGAISTPGFSTQIEITDSTFTGNESGNAGGAVYGAGLSVARTTFTDNNSISGGGGALFGLSVFAIESTFTDNASRAGGAIATLTSASFGSVVGSTFVGNSAVVFGGAVNSEGGFTSLNSTYVENTAGEKGGAVYAGYGQIALSTFLENEASTEILADQSDAVFVDGNGLSMDVGGNIFAGSRPNAQLGAGPDATYDDRGGNVFSTPTATEGALGALDPSTLFSRSVTSIFGPSPVLADNGGPTETVALVSGSPAIDAIPASTFDMAAAPLPSTAEQSQALAELLPAAADIDVDQRDVARTGLADAGAFEFGDSELAATGVDASMAGWLAGLAALMLGVGVTVARGARRPSRITR